MRVCIIFGFVLAASAVSVHIPKLQQRHYQFEDTADIDGDGIVISRSEAINGQVLHVVGVTSNTRVFIKLCIEPEDESQEVIVYIDDIRYSNDGGSDLLLLSVDNEPAGVFQTVAESDYGYLWNVFRNSGPIGSGIPLNASEYNLTVVTITDLFGLDLDSIRLNFHNQRKDVDIICKTEDDRGLAIEHSNGVENSSLQATEADGYSERTDNTWRSLFIATTLDQLDANVQEEDSESKEEKDNDRGKEGENNDK